MPLLELTMPHGVLAPHEVQELAAELTEMILRWERAPRDSRTARQLTWFYVHEAAHILVAGSPATVPRYRLDVTLPAGMLDDDRKAGFVAEATDAIVRIDGSDDADATFRVWCLLHEVPDGNWGADGRIYDRDDIVELVVTDARAPQLDGSP